MPQVCPNCKVTPLDWSVLGGRTAQHGSRWRMLLGLCSRGQFCIFDKGDFLLRPPNRAQVLLLDLVNIFAAACPRGRAMVATKLEVSF